MNNGRQKIVSFWIPVEEELPPRPGVYNVTIEFEYWGQSPFFQKKYTHQKSTVAKWDARSGWELVDPYIFRDPFCRGSKRVLAWTYLPGIYIPPKEEHPT